MTDRRQFLTLTGASAASIILFGCRAAPAQPPEKFEVVMSDAAWRKKLGPASYQVLRHENTETPFTSPLNNEHRAGIFACKGCALPLYSSKTKFESGTGWPSFWQPLPNAVRTRDEQFDEPKLPQLQMASANTGGARMIGVRD